jgi:hypothetical protein
VTVFGQMSFTLGQSDLRRRCNSELDRTGWKCSKRASDSGLLRGRNNWNLAPQSAAIVEHTNGETETSAAQDARRHGYSRVLPNTSILTSGFHEKTKHTLPKLRNLSCYSS